MKTTSSNKCDCGSACKDRVHVVAECRSYKKEREVYMTELGKVEERYREMFEAWNSQDKKIAVLGHRKWVEKAGSDIGRTDGLGKTFLRHLWQSRNERLTIGDRSFENNAPSFRGRVVNGLTAKACKTLQYAPLPPLTPEDRSFSDVFASLGA
ncbi:unnamed protein product [Ectocarpus sp. 6 AP-2014]